MRNVPGQIAQVDEAELAELDEHADRQCVFLLILGDRQPLSQQAGLGWPPPFSGAVSTSPPQATTCTSNPSNGSLSPGAGTMCWPPLRTST